MDKHKLELLLKPFQDRCIAEGINVAKLIISKTHQDSNNDFYVDVCIPNLTADNYEELLDKTYDILLNTIDKKIRNYVFTFCVT